MISLSTASVYPYGLNRIFTIAKKSGFNGVELMIRSKSDNGFFDTWDPKYIKKLSKKHDIVVNSIHLPFDFEEEPKEFEELYKLSEKINTKFIIAHIPRKDQKKFIEWYSHNKDTKKILFENIHTKERIENPILNNDLSDIKNLCYDIAHALRSGHNVKKDIQKYKNNIKEFHISNWDGEDDHLSILGNKTLFKTLFKNMKDKQNINFCLELCPKAFTSIENQTTLIKELRDNRKFLKKIIQ